MAKTNAILTEDRSTAAPVALALLCALALGQAFLLVQAVWSDLRPGVSPPLSKAAPVAATPAVVTPQAAPSPLPVPAVPAPTSPAPAIQAAPSPVPPPATSASSLPPLPALANGLPPLPSLSKSPPPGQSLGRTLPSATDLAPGLPPPPGRTFPSLPPATAPAPTTAPRASGPAARTGNAQVDELIEVAVQSRELNDADGAMQALERADLVLPDNPVVLREKAMTYGKMGRADKAQAMWDRVSRLGPGAGAGSMVPPASGTAPPGPQPNAPDALNSAFASLGASGAAPAASGPLTLGRCQVIHDATVTKGQKVLLKIPVQAQPGLRVAVSDWNLDVLFYDRVDGARLEPTNADPVAMTFDMPVDFQSSEEIVTAVYHMPELSAQEMANIGRRELGGYVVKLYYQNRLMSTAASPRELLSGSSDKGGGVAPVANPLFPPATK